MEPAALVPGIGKDGGLLRNMIPPAIRDIAGAAAASYPNTPMPIKVIQPTIMPIAKSR